jgi:hypothetical protein
MRYDTTSANDQTTTTDLAQMGVNQIAYIKPVEVDGTTAWSIHGADGTALTVVRDHDQAFAVVRQNDMEPVSVH